VNTAVTVNTPAGRETWELTHHEAGDGREVALRSTDGTRWEASGPHLFDALIAVREQIEPAGVRLCCAASRLDVWPSPLLRSMSDGEAAYVLRIGRRPTGRDVVGVLEPADCSLVVPVDEQRAYFARWVRTVTGWRYPLNAILSRLGPGR
jgi:hypothetical protein